MNVNISYLLFGLSCLLSLGLLEAKGQKISAAAKAHYQQAQSYAANNDNPLAEGEYRKAIAANKGYYPAAWRDFSWYLSQRLRFAEAAVAFETHLKQTPPKEIHQDDYQYLADFQTVVRLEKLVQRQPQPSLQTLLEYGRLVFLLARTRDQAAIRIAEKAVALYPDSVAALLMLESFLDYANVPPPERRLALLEKAQKLEPQNAEVAYRLGGLYAFSFPKTAEEHYKRALQFSNGSHAESWQGLGRVYKLQGRRQEAIAAFKSYLRIGKVSPQYRIEIENEIKRLEQQ